MKNIILCGFMGCGKSTVGKLLADKLGMCFTDCDSRIESQEHMTVPEIFTRYGERYFRAAESTAVSRLLTLSNTVIASGGGTVLLKKNAEMFKSLGTVIFLSVNADTVIGRLKDDTSRPLLARDDKEAAISALIAEREPFYKAAAHFTVNADAGADTVTENIIALLGHDT